MGRAPCCSKVGLHRGPWTAREDALLIKYIEAHGEGQWRSLPKKAGLLRCGKSCRLRWMNYLRPDIKRGNITPDEDELIIRLHSLLGNRWSLIAGRLPGRTDNEIKNYWNTHLSKRLRIQGTDPNTHKKLSQVDLEAPVINNRKRCRSSINYNNANKRKTQKPNGIAKKGVLMEGKNGNTSEEKKRTKIHLPKPVRVTSINIPLTRNNSNGSFETNVSTTTSASSSQSQNQLFDSENVTLDMSWTWLSNNIADITHDNELDHLMMMGSCDDHHDVDLDMTRHHHDEVTPPDDNKQLQKLYEEYLQLIKADHHDHHNDDDNDDDHNDGDEGHLDSFAESFLI